MKHTLDIGTRIELVLNEFLDHLDNGLQGTVVELTFDDCNPTYTVQFDNGNLERHVYFDEIIKIL
jgi:hypothetical protein